MEKIKLGDRIRELRETVGISQAELGRRIGQTSRTYISELELGKRRGINLDTLTRIAHALNTTASALIQDTEFDENCAPHRLHREADRCGSGSPVSQGRRPLHYLLWYLSRISTSPQRLAGQSVDSTRTVQTASAPVASRQMNAGGANAQQGHRFAPETISRAVNVSGVQGCHAHQDSARRVMIFPTRWPEPERWQWG